MPVRILIVDDEPSILEVIQQACSREGHEAATAASAHDALDYLAKNSVDLLISDIAMPPPDGLQLVRDARSIQANIMTLVMTGHLGRYSVADVQASGANDLMYKPLRLEELRVRIAFADQRRRVIEGLNARRRELQQMCADMIKGVQEELEETRRAAKAAAGRGAPKGADAHPRVAGAAAKPGEAATHPA
jgi:DNA-binding response OmpR family regulator